MVQKGVFRTVQADKRPLKRRLVEIPHAVLEALDAIVDLIERVAGLAGAGCLCARERRAWPLVAFCAAAPNPDRKLVEVCGGIPEMHALIDRGPVRAEPHLPPTRIPDLLCILLLGVRVCFARVARHLNDPCRAGVCIPTVVKNVRRPIRMRAGRSPAELLVARALSPAGRPELAVSAVRDGRAPLQPADFENERRSGAAATANVVCRSQRHNAGRTHGAR